MLDKQWRGEADFVLWALRGMRRKLFWGEDGTGREQEVAADYSTWLDF